MADSKGNVPGRSEQAAVDANTTNLWLALKNQSKQHESNLLSPRSEYDSQMISDAETEGTMLRLYWRQIKWSLIRFEREQQARSYLMPHVVTVFVHESGVEPRGYLPPGLVFNISRYRDITVSYQKIVNKLLPPPFPSACFEYGQQNSVMQATFSNQKDCVEYCLDHEPRDGRTSPSTLHLINQTDAEEDQQSLMRHADSVIIRLHCIKSCPLPCKRTEYFSKRQLEKESGDGILALGTGQAEISVTFKARTEPFEFVIFIAGCFNLWFGVAVYGSTIDVCRDLSRRCFPPSALKGADKKQRSHRSHRRAGSSIRKRSVDPGSGNDRRRMRSQQRRCEQSQTMPPGIFLREQRMRDPRIAKVSLSPSWTRTGREEGRVSETRLPLATPPPAGTSNLLPDNRSDQRTRASWLVMVTRARHSLSTWLQLLLSPRTSKDRLANLVKGLHARLKRLTAAGPCHRGVVRTQ